MESHSIKTTQLSAAAAAAAACFLDDKCECGVSD
jgi:hypothetical protein